MGRLIRQGMGNRLRHCTIAMAPRRCRHDAMATTGKDSVVHQFEI